MAPVEDDDGKGRTTRSRANRDNKRGTPQGSPISPLMSNLYMRRFVEGWRRLGLQQRWSAHIVNYADDFVICCKRGADDAMAAMREIMGRIKLTVNEDKTHLCQIPRERFDFLGYTFGQMLFTQGRACLHRHSAFEEEYQADGGQPQRGHGSPHGAAGCRRDCGSAEPEAAGWANYFCLGPSAPRIGCSTPTLDNGCVDGCARNTKWRARGRRASPTSISMRYWGWFDLAPRTHDLPWAKA